MQAPTPMQITGSYYAQTVVSREALKSKASQTCHHWRLRDIVLIVAADESLQILVDRKLHWFVQHLAAGLK